MFLPVQLSCRTRHIHGLCELDSGIEDARVCDNAGHIENERIVRRRNDSRLSNIKHGSVDDTVDKFSP